MTYYKKIDIYYNGSYYRSTNKAKRCKDAVNNLIDYLERHKHSIAGLGRLETAILNNPKGLKAYFVKEST